MSKKESEMTPAELYALSDKLLDEYQQATLPWRERSIREFDRVRALAISMLVPERRSPEDFSTPINYDSASLLEDEKPLHTLLSMEQLVLEWIDVTRPYFDHIQAKWLNDTQGELLDLADSLPAYIMNKTNGVRIDIESAWHRPPNFEPLGHMEAKVLRTKASLALDKIRPVIAMELEALPLQSELGKRMKEWNRHVNGGGWVHEGAFVAPEAFVSPRAVVAGSAQVLGGVVNDKAVVDGNAVVKPSVYGSPRLSDKAYVTDNASIEGDAWVRDKAIIFGNSVIRYKARIFGEAAVGESAIVDGGVVSNDTYLGGREVYRSEYTRTPHRYRPPEHALNKSVKETSLRRRF